MVFLRSCFLLSLNSLPQAQVQAQLKKPKVTLVWFPRNFKGPGQRALLISPMYQKRHIVYKMLKKTDCQNKETHFVEFISVARFCFVANKAIYFTKGPLFMSVELFTAGSYTNTLRFQPYRIIPCLYSTAGRRAMVCLYSDRS